MDSEMGHASDEQESRDRLWNRIRLVDQLTTMHASLRDRFRSIALTLNLGVLCASVLATAFAFAGGDQRTTIFGIDAMRSSWLGWLAVATFSVTLIDIVTDRKSAARKHEDAVHLLAALKSEYQREESSEDSAVTVAARLEPKYHDIMSKVPPIPERHFNRLKAAHLRKVAVSKFLSAHPGITRRQAEREVKKIAKLGVSPNTSSDENR